jgi:hypothetical protein
MKTIIPLIVILFASCTKTDTPPTQKTMLTVENQTDYYLTHVIVSYDGKILNDIQSITRGAISDPNEVASPTVSLFFDGYGQTFGVVDPYVMKAGQTNNIILDRNTQVKQISKKDDGYPKTGK